MKFLEQLKLQALRRFQEESSLYDSALDDHVSALEAIVAESNEGIALISGVSIHGRDSKVQYVNPAFTRMTGYSAEEIIGNAASAIRKISGTAIDAGSAGETERDLSIISAETECSTKGGAKFWAEVNLTPLKNDTGQVEKWIYTLRDITERRQKKSIDARLLMLQAESDRLAVEVEQHKAIEADLAHRAFHDGLTGLRNRQYFLDRLGEALERTLTRPSYRSAVIYIDLDGFKGVNDKLGHRGGDRILLETAQRLKKCCRAQDTIARLGGDEFALLIDDITGERGAVVVQRILDGLSAPFQIDSDTLSVAPSLGYCVVEPSYTSAQDVVRDADTAMYRAKRKGGANCVFFDESINESVAVAASQRQELSQAIEDGELELHYQPLLDILTTPPKLWGVEALVRWRHPRRGLLLPVEFLPLAEDTGLAVPLGLSVLRSACQQMKEWQSYVLNPDFLLSVNVSTSQLNDPNFFRDLVDILADVEIDARCLQIELTEETATQNSKVTAEKLQQIRDLGIRVALDNFGAGSASITQLEKCPADTLKIDGSMIKRLAGDPKEAQMPRMIMEFGRALGLRMIAERVEDQAEGDVLRQYGCTLVQGNAFSPAVEKGKITRILDLGTSSLKLERSRRQGHEVSSNTT